MEKNYYVYILLCADGSLYTGWTDDLARRTLAHQSGRGAKYTKGRRPVSLAYFEELTSKSDALKREHAIKKLTRADKLRLIDGKQQAMPPPEGPAGAPPL